MTLRTSFRFSELQLDPGHKGLALAVPVPKWSTGHDMLRISTLETQSQRRLIVEGKLISPWVEELTKSWSAAAADLNGRELVVDLTHTTVISPEGQEALIELMKQGAKFSGCGVLTKHILKALATACHGHRQNANKKQAIS